MDTESPLPALLLVSLVNLAFSLLLERLLKPRPLLHRSARAWAAHAGLCCLALGLLLLMSRRPWCSLVGVQAVMLTLVLVSNAKLHSLREPFIFQDYDYFLDALRFPRLFLPFLGIKNFVLAAALFVVALLGLTAETPLPLNFQSATGIIFLLITGLVLLVYTTYTGLSPCFTPKTDMLNLGLLGSLLAYAKAQLQKPNMHSPFLCLPAKQVLRQPLPHLVAVQSESFFDARNLSAIIKNEVLTELDAACAQSPLHGVLRVPAWGANTVRTEFSFLSGIVPRHLGAHRFNPYRAIAKGEKTASLPVFLQRLGYRCLCIHPYAASYYSRNTTMPALGFDVFLDEQAFAGARRFGPYIADAEVKKAIGRILAEATSPTFIFVVTMENHGPLHLEQARPKDEARFYSAPPPPLMDELTVYLRHLRHADSMLGGLRRQLAALNTPASLCWYGDHVPIMPAVYRTMGAPCGHVPFVCWHNSRQGPPASSASLSSPLPAHALALAWMRSLGLA